MSKIREAAKTEPGGMAQVLSEMKEGGRFSDLRKQFSNALADDAGVAAAYDKAASSLAAYGKKPHGRPGHHRPAGGQQCPDTTLRPTRCRNWKGCLDDTQQNRWP